MNPYEYEVIHEKLNMIKKIEKESIADDLGLEIGDQVISINGKEILDVIDYRYEIYNQNITLKIVKKNKEVWEFDIEKDSEEDLGVEFFDPLLDKQKQCSNNCVFCFIDQLPRGMRESLYIKDDDSRLSFLQGNYITLTNVSERDFQRIIDYKLSPINVSVHTTNPDLRIEMLKNPKSGKILEQLKILTNNGITINAQVVLIPGMNDGVELEKTLNDLYILGDNISSVAVVPVGITKYQKKRLPIYNRESSNSLLSLVESFALKCKAERGYNWVYASDEFYLIAEKNIPQQEYYDNYLQYENGVGLLRSFYDESIEFLYTQEYSLKSGKVQIITGEYSALMFETVKKKINEIFPNISIEITIIKNNFFGEYIKVAGLLTGTDIIDQLKGNVCDDIMVPRVMFRQDKFITLDDFTLSELENILGCNIHPIENNGEKFCMKLLEVSING